MRRNVATDYGIRKLEKALPDICLYWNVSKDDILSKCRDRNLVYARHSLRYLLYQDKKLPLAEIGTLTNCDHATVLHSVKMFRILMNQDFMFNQLFAMINKQLVYNRHSTIKSKIKQVMTSDLSQKEQIEKLEDLYNENR